MPFKARLYIALVVLAGWAALVKGLVEWHTTDWVGFVLYTGVSLLASGYKLRLPGITATVSAGFLLMLIGIVCLSLPEAVLGGCAAVAFQCIWNATSRPRPVQIAFSVASVAIAITVSANVFYSRWLHNLGFEFAIQLIVLGLVYFIASTLPVAGVIALTERKPLWSVWSGSYFWSFAHYLVGAGVAGLFVTAKQHLGWQTAMLIVPMTYIIYRSYNLYIGRMDDARRHAEETAALHFRTIESLALAIEAKDQTTHDHLRRVRVYAMGIGEELKLGAVELDALKAAALLHDIGKIAVPEFIISKPGKLTPDEFQKMKVHPVVGAEILERVRFPFPVAPIVRAHHEKWDGSGYPSGLKGEEIPIGARILSVVDCLDALASDRQYRRALPLPEAMAMVERDSGRAFDPKIVAVLKRLYVHLEETARSSQLEQWRLSTDINIERGAEPGAGFATSESRQRADGVAAPSAGESERVRLRCLLEAVTNGARFLSPSETFSIFSTRLAAMVPFDGLAVNLRQANMLLPVYTAGNFAGAMESARIPVGSGISGWVAETNRAVINGNADVELCFGTRPPGSQDLRSALAIPLSGQGSLAGVLTLYRTAEDTFSSEELAVLTSFGAALGAYLEKDAAAIMGPADAAAFAPMVASAMTEAPAMIH
jgi:putative nucleotidyltransferase with HDIG domain